MRCLYKQDESFNKCIKYIFAHFIRDTCGTHHGHEIYDMGGETDFNGESVFVAFLAKSKLDSRKEKDNLFVQFFDCTYLEELNILSVVSPKDLDNELTIRLRRVMSNCKGKQRYCMILMRQMARILYYFNKNHLNKLEEKI
jgi:hypothetical protein